MWVLVEIDSYRLQSRKTYNKLGILLLNECPELASTVFQQDYKWHTYAKKRVEQMAQMEHSEIVLHVDETKGCLMQSTHGKLEKK